MRCAVFAHYDVDNIVDDYVLYYLEELAKAVDYIVFVSDSDLSTEESLKVSAITDLQIIGRHGEYDFGSYKRGYHLLKKMNIHQYEELVFCNDSCYGPLSPLSEVWNKAATIPAEFWGLTWGTDPKFHIHIQSFFLVFQKQVFTSEIFSSFMGSIKAEEFKIDIIEKYEVGLSQALIENGFKCNALFHGKPKHANPPIECPFEIIRQGFPFLKVALLRNNPRRVTKLSRYNAYTSETLQKFIKKNLERTAPDYNSHMHDRFHPCSKYLIHPKLFKIQLKNMGEVAILQIRLLGIQILKLKLRAQSDT